MIKGWKLKKGECCTEMREELKLALGSSEELSEYWEITAGVVRERAMKVFPLDKRKRTRRTGSCMRKCLNVFKGRG